MKAIEETLRLAKGKDLGAAEMPQGWTSTSLDGLIKTVEEQTVIQKPIPGAFTYKYVNYPTEEVVSTIGKSRITPGTPLAAIGATSLLADIFRQALNPTFKKGKKNTILSTQRAGDTFVKRNEYDHYIKDLPGDYGDDER